MPANERREQLLDAALQVIAEDGYAGVTIEAVARRAGVTRPVVYGVFEDLGALLAALLQRQERRALELLDRAVPADPGDLDPDALLVNGIRAFLDAVARDPDTWRVVLVPPEGTPPAIRDYVEANRMALLRRLETLVGWGLERRGGPTGLDVELLARSILSAAEEAGRLMLADPDRFPAERFARLAARLLALAPRR
jgi:AcrR family transcriptional regulator